MERVVTIVAKPPEECEACEEDSEIESVRKAIEEQAPKSHVIERAATLQTLADILERERERLSAPELVQIIGHGIPGLLLLGQSWPLHELRLPTAARYSLDSDPDNHVILQGRVAPSTRVWLLGCGVGMSAASGRVSDGPTLLFHLLRLWRCAEVSAPVDLVIDEDFRDGVYWPIDCLTQAKELRVTLGRERDDPAWKSSVHLRSRAPGIGAELPAG